MRFTGVKNRKSNAIFSVLLLNKESSMKIIIIGDGKVGYSLAETYPMKTMMSLYR